MLAIRDIWSQNPSFSTNGCLKFEKTEDSGINKQDMVHFEGQLGLE